MEYNSKYFLVKVMRHKVIGNILKPETLLQKYIISLCFNTMIESKTCNRKIGHRQIAKNVI